MQKITIIALLLLSSCTTDPMKVHFDNWRTVASTLSKNKGGLAGCRDKTSKVEDKHVVYTFNVKERSIASVKIFRDPYEAEKGFHDCVKKELSKISIDLRKEKEFRNGYLLINNKEERFNYVLY